MTRIAIIAHAHPQTSLGGGELAAHGQFRALQAAGEEATFLGICSDEAAARRIFGPAARLQQLGVQDFCLRLPPMDPFTMDQARAEDEDWLVDLLVGLEAEVYHFHHFWNIGAGTIRRLRAARPDARLVCTLHEYAAICANHGQMVTAGGQDLCSRSGPVACATCLAGRAPVDFVLRRARLLRMLDQFDLLISPSLFLRQRMEEWGIAPGRISVLENGLDMPDAGPEDTLETLAERARTFAFFGSATPTKGLDVLVRAASRLAGKRQQGRQVSIAVHGVTRGRFEELWPGLDVPPNLRFQGRYAPGEAVSLMRGYGWVVVPSTWWENAPVVIEEARAARTPVIASGIGGMLEKTQAFGRHFPPGDAVGLADLMTRLAGDVTALIEHRQAITPPLSHAQYLKAWHGLLAGLAARGDRPGRLALP
ncbi:glycosyltransferase [Halovulum dunhuangense]|uniref:Glycosyltransferase n=1 Tax=Halovulum dunhuangense TaxID=1505036 RepID=A0A849L456_9RHOB|nr:glycosyltransferase [Halovulum dunhuangense]NNU80984.1 glycosyltransferase [Halovulum dunhuangense]